MCSDIQRIQDIARFLSNIKIIESGCWEWQGWVNKKGYGNMNIKGKTIQAHRFAYQLFNGNPIPDGLVSDHLCRNRRCVNPLHLEAVTNRENVIRGNLPTLMKALHSSKTHCPHGHPYDEENTYYKPTGYRECRICKRLSFRNWKAKRRNV